MNGELAEHAHLEQETCGELLSEAVKWNRVCVADRCFNCARGPRHTMAELEKMGKSEGDRAV